MNINREARVTLLKLREQLEQRLKRIDKQALQPFDSDLEDQAIESEREEVLTRLSDQTHMELWEIEKALSRIDRNEYGTCVRCGNPIALERLQAVPFADECIACAKKSPSGVPAKVQLR